MNNRGIIHIKERQLKQGDFLFYMHQFIEAGKNAGFNPLAPTSSPKYLFRRVMPFILCIMNAMQFYRLRKKILIVSSRGDGILEASYPHYLSYHIIPMLWDTWPKEQDWLFKDLRRLRCPLVLVSSRQMAIRIERELNIKSLWVPEGIDIRGFNKGNDLSTRPTDVFELGRQHHQYHIALETALTKNFIKSWKGNVYGKDGSLHKLACANTEELKETLALSKIVVCFPKIDTAPYSESGNIETLTQRYWEAMLSRCLIVGRAPAELTDLLGYYPVVDVDWNNPTEQLRNILSNISDYQWLVDKNLEAAKRLAPWDSRMNEIKTFINDHLKV